MIMKKTVLIFAILLAATGCQKCYTCYPTGVPSNSQTICFYPDEVKKQLIAIDTAPGKYYFKDTLNICVPN